MDQQETVTENFLSALHLQALEGNPLSADEIAMFEMFEREGWPHERRLAFLRERARAEALVESAE